MRSGVESIEIESFTCTQCNANARDLIFLPCKHCHMCVDCYTEKEDKKKCGRCNKEIKKLIRIYVSNN